MKILITAGPTREYIDSVRFISNPSTGKMGVSLAYVAQERGHEVKLICGYIDIDINKEIDYTQAYTTCEMLKRVEETIDWCDILIMAAAPVDWIPEEKIKNKIKKSETTEINLKLIKNKDILKTISLKRISGEIKKEIIISGFSLDVNNSIENAQKKLKSKKIDIIFANVDSERTGFSTDTNQIYIITKEGLVRKTELMSKRNIATEIIKFIESYK